MKTLYKKWISDLGSFFTREESVALCELVDAIPDRNTFVHCDAHIGNVMIQNGELILIDMADAGIGHPIFDIGTLCFHYRLMPNSSGRDFGLKTILGFVPENNDMLDAIWNDLIKVYFEPKSKEDLIKINKIAFVIGNLRSTVTAAKHSQMSDEIKKTIVDATKKILLPEIEDYTKLISHVDDYFAN